MKRLFTFLFATCLATALFAQNETAEYVYFIMQQRCASCHGNTNPAGQLDLVGNGANQAAKMLDVYNRLVGRPPNNTYAAGEGFKLIEKGQFYESFLFRKINDGLQPDLTLDMQEGDPHSDPMLHTITDVEKEAIRQWILFDAPPSGKVVDIPMLQKYYSGDSVASFTSVPPAPNPAEGFQIHMGPFFLPEGAEDEFYWKYPTRLQVDKEVTKLEILFGLYSHHLILYELDKNFAGQVKTGIRRDNAHVFSKLVSANQFPDTTTLPSGSAFFWNAGTVLDVNSHYINYSSDKVAKCEAYINVYTQPSGIAKQEMKSEITANTNIWIPNDGITRKFETPLYEAGVTTETFLWGITSHTHQWGTDFNIYKRTQFGDKDDLIFDAEYTNGDPNDFYLGYDYQHPPIRYFDDFLPIKANEGIIYEASYSNTGPRAVGFGNTSEDEMMVIAFFYLEDTTGVGNVSTAIDNPYPEARIAIAPNPIAESAVIWVEDLAVSELSFSLLDAMGKEVSKRSFQVIPSQPNRLRFERNGLASGIYFYQMTDENGRFIASGKVFMR